MAAYPYYTAALEDGGSLDHDTLEGHSSYHDARSTAEADARQGIARGRRVVILEARETVWAEPQIKDDLPQAAVQP
jgi:hypothetical protein